MIAAWSVARFRVESIPDHARCAHEQHVCQLRVGRHAVSVDSSLLSNDAALLLPRNGAKKKLKFACITYGVEQVPKMFKFCADNKIEYRTGKKKKKKL